MHKYRKILHTKKGEKMKIYKTKLVALGAMKNVKNHCISNGVYKKAANQGKHSCKKVS